MRHLDLFSGIGGFALAARWMGWHTAAFCERDPYCQKLLAQNFPDTPIHDDIRTIPPIGGIDIITGGFPCQPFSVAGVKKGKEDDRYLWPRMLEVIACEKPTYVIGENVAGIVGMALDQVLFDLEGEGYASQSFIIPACATDAPHRRDRVWIIANSIANGSGSNKKRRAHGTPEAEFEDIPKIDGEAYPDDPEQVCGFLAYTDNTGRKKQWGSSAAEPQYKAIKRGGEWSPEPPVGRVANGVSNRVDRIKGLGNAIVPQVAYTIFKSL